MVTQLKYIVKSYKKYWDRWGLFSLISKRGHGGGCLKTLKNG